MYQQEPYPMNQQGFQTPQYNGGYVPPKKPGFVLFTQIYQWFCGVFGCLVTLGCAVMFLIALDGGEAASEIELGVGECFYFTLASLASAVLSIIGAVKCAHRPKSGMVFVAWCTVILFIVCLPMEFIGEPSTGVWRIVDLVFYGIDFSIVAYTCASYNSLPEFV